VLPAPSDTL